MCISWSRLAPIQRMRLLCSNCKCSALQSVGILRCSVSGGTAQTGSSWIRLQESNPEIACPASSSPNPTLRSLLSALNRSLPFPHSGRGSVPVSMPVIDGGISRLLAAGRQDGRGDRIRTCDLLVPNQALYQAKLHPEMRGHRTTLCRGSQEGCPLVRNLLACHSLCLSPDTPYHTIHGYYFSRK
jgi:hypothetical protein